MASFGRGTWYDFTSAFGKTDKRISDFLSRALAQDVTQSTSFGGASLVGTLTGTLLTLLTSGKAGSDIFNGAVQASQAGNTLQLSASAAGTVGAAVAVGVGVANAIWQGWLLAKNSSGQQPSRTSSPRPNAGGPGKWEEATEAMSDASRDYQKKVTGNEGWVYKLNDVKFDGYDTQRNVLLDAKAKYDQFIKNGNWQQWFTGQETLVDEARRQVTAAKGIPIEWHCLQQDTADAIERLLKANNVSGISVIYSP